MRRKPGTLLPLEIAILGAAIDLRRNGTDEFYGYLIAREVKGNTDAKLLTSHGTLYKALDRMQKAGLLESRWEDPAIAANEERPRRRLYEITAVGQVAFVQQEQPAAAGGSLQEGLQPS